MTFRWQYKVEQLKLEKGNEAFWGFFFVLQVKGEKYWSKCNMFNTKKLIASSKHIQW